MTCLESRSTRVFNARLATDLGRIGRELSTYATTFSDVDAKSYYDMLGKVLDKYVEELVELRRYVRSCE